MYILAVASCPYGSPVPGSNCGRGGQECDLGFYCNIDPADRFAVCCPIEGYVKG